MNTDTGIAFTPITLGAIDMANRFAMVKYYAQRAGAGLIITEATEVSPQDTGSIAVGEAGDELHPVDLVRRRGRLLRRPDHGRRILRTLYS